MKQALLFQLIMLLTFTGCSQSSNQNNKSAQRIGGPCEGCEAIFENPIPFEKLHHIDTLPDFYDKGLKIEISGVLFQNDRKTPAKDVIIYVYHTDQTGVYPVKGDEKGWGKRHGYIRGWMKTNEKGEYKFYTLKPAAYPGRSFPAHIHITIKEPGKNEYYIDDYHFDDDPLLTANERGNMQNRGGNGIIKLKHDNGIWKAQRNIILGLHVQGYPVK